MLAQLINTSTQTTIHLDALRLDGGTQPRDGLNTAYVTELAQSLQDGAALPPIDVMHDGANYWLFDGFHRVAAHRKANILIIPATIHQGDQAAAQWRSYAANQTHGLRRTNDDKKRAILAALRHPNAATLSNREIGRHLDVDHKTIATYREQLQATGEIPSQTQRTGADGRTIDTTNIGVKPAPVCYIMNNDALFELANDTYSADLMANGKNRIRKPFKHDGKLWVCVGVTSTPKQKTAECIRVHEPGDAVSNGENYPAYLKDAFLGRKVMCGAATYYLGAQWLIISAENVVFRLTNDDIPPELRADGWEIRSRGFGSWWLINEAPGKGCPSAAITNRTQFDNTIASLLKKLHQPAPTIQPVDDRPLPAWAQSTTADTLTPAAVPPTDEPTTADTLTPADLHVMQPTPPISQSPTPLSQLNAWWVRLVTLRSELGDWADLTGRHTDTLGIVRELNKLIDLTQAELDAITTGAPALALVEA